MRLDEIKAAVEAGKTVHWANADYTVVKDGLGQWLVCHIHGHAIGLTWRDGATLNGNPEEFYVGPE